MASGPPRGLEKVALLREAYEDEGVGRSLEGVELELTWVAPLFEYSFIPRMVEQYTGPTCFACSDRLWDSYTVSARRNVDDLPLKVKHWLESATLPPYSLFNAFETVIGGWSVAPSDPQLREYLRSANAHSRTEGSATACEEAGQSSGHLSGLVPRDEAL
jgi:hypothetical protein